VSSGKVESASAPHAAEDQRRIEQDRKQCKAKHAEAGYASPVPPRGPRLALHQREQQQKPESDAEAERANDERIDSVDQIARGADRGAAKTAGQHRRQHTPSFAHQASPIPSHPQISTHSSLAAENRKRLLIREWNFCDNTNNGL